MKAQATPDSNAPLSCEKKSPASNRAQRLGFLRFWRGLFALIVLTSITALLFKSHATLYFNLDIYFVFADAIVGGVVFWLIGERKRAARTIVCLYAVTVLLIGFVYDLISNGFELSFSYVLNHGHGIFLFIAVYFIFSRRARTVLVEPFDMRGNKAHERSERMLYRPFDPLFWRDLILFFMVFSVVGHLMERLYEGTVHAAMGFYDPSAPLWQSYLEPFSIYGIGTVLCILLLFPLKQALMRRLSSIWLVLLFVYLANTAVCTGVELTVGLLSNQPDANGSLPFWDYSNMPFNFRGQVCLQNSLAFGLAATLLVWTLFPAIEGFILTLSKDTMELVTVSIVIAYLLLVSLYLITLPLPPVPSA
jgi:uncharacterized membrane protein